MTLTNGSSRAKSISKRWIQRSIAKSKALCSFFTVLTTKDESILIEGVKYVKHGRGELNKLPKSDSFAQLVQIADSILQATKYDEEQNSLGIKRLPFDPFGWKNKRQYAKIQGTIKDDPAMKAEALRLTGVHSPLSPHKWRKDN